MEKLVLKAKDEDNLKYNPVFIDYKSHQKIKKLNEATGIPMRELVKKFIDFGMDNMVIETSDDGSKPE